MNPKTISILARIQSNAKEPALKVGAVITIVTSLFGVLNLAAPNLLSEDTEFLILGIAALLLPIVTAIFTRGRVWSPATVKELLREAIRNAQAELEKEQDKNETLRAALEEKTSISEYPPIRTEDDN